VPFRHSLSKEGNWKICQDGRPWGSNLNFITFRHLRLSLGQGRGKSAGRCLPGPKLKVPSRHFLDWGKTEKPQPGWSGREQVDQSLSWRYHPAFAWCEENREKTCRLGQSLVSNIGPPEWESNALYQWFCQTPCGGVTTKFLRKH